jgi:aryl-alcohol dehydrogenase-like predicted oxidoreductase
MKFVDAGGARLSAIGLGTWQFGSTEWGYGSAYARGEAVSIVHRALDLGVNVIDTAEVYGIGQSEKIVGEAIKGLRDKVFLATKLFPVGLPFQVASRARGSARRLGVDRLDLYQLHWPSPMFPPRSTMPRMKRLVDEGLVTHAGVSNHSLAAWREAERAFGGQILSNQVQFSLVNRTVERELLPWAQREGRVIIAYSPLGQGALSGRYQSSAPRNFRRMRADFTAAGRVRLAPMVAALQEIGRAHGATASQVALAWLIRKPNVVAIPGASSVHQVEENVAAGELDLTDQEDARLNDISARARR